MAPEFISEGTPKARKPHQCFDCYRKIAVGERHHHQVLKYDGVYQLRCHIDCHEAALDYISEGYPPDYYDGVPPLYDMLTDSGEFAIECARLRGRWPHVVARMELNEQLSDIRWRDRLAAQGIEPDCAGPYG